MQNNIFKFHNGSLGLFVFIMIFSTSCKKLIEIPVNPIDKLPISRVFSDSADIMGAVAGVYANFGAASYGGFITGYITKNTALTSDELYPAALYPNDLFFYHNNILINNSDVGGMWSDAYKTIFQINTVIEGVSSTAAISEALKQQLIGEMEVARSLFYFNLVNIWGEVPLVTGTDYKINKTKPRASIDSVYKQILSDLSGAQQKLTPTYPSDGHLRPNIYVAQALVAKVYLYLGRYQEALEAANSVINSGDYSMVTDLNGVFLDGSTEAIWQIPANGIYQATPDAASFIPYDPSYVPEYSLTATLINSFESGDQRKVKWLNYNNVDNGNGTFTLYYYPYKYKNKQPTQTPTEDYMLLRLADTYLVRAEASAQLGDLTAALADLNIVRQRAGLTPSNFSLKADVINAIMHERQIELFCELGNRWFDLKRTGTINAVLGTEKNNWETTDALFPIPQFELQANPYLKQNPGY
ncbi:MAG: RagB/SusD family nutrient uptake outer membrane protein [Bacteroidota bacterium]|nr:RagB/SusD family nutrient uptake outer membrane protein [Bacteroidota bacterium]